MYIVNKIIVSSRLVLLIHRITLFWDGCFCLVICNPLPRCSIARSSLSWADDALIVANFHLKAMVSPWASSCSPITGSSCRWCLTILTWWPNVVSKSSTHASGPDWGLRWLTRYCLSKSKWIILVKARWVKCYPSWKLGRNDNGCFYIYQALSSLRVLKLIILCRKPKKGKNLRYSK